MSSRHFGSVNRTVLSSPLLIPPVFCHDCQHNGCVRPLVQQTSAGSPNGSVRHVQALCTQAAMDCCCDCCIKPGTHPTLLLLLMHSWMSTFALAQYVQALTHDTVWMRHVFDFHFGLHWATLGVDVPAPHRLVFFPTAWCHGGRTAGAVEAVHRWTAWKQR